MFILRWLRNTDQPILSYVWRAWLLDRIPTLVIVVILGEMFETKGGNLPPTDSNLWLYFLGIVFVAPWAETILMWPILSLLKRVTGNQRTLWIALPSAAIWGILHALMIPMWGLTVFWGFFILSLCFLEWEKKSKRSAIVVTALVHTCMNTVPHGIMVLLLIFMGP